MLSPVEWGIFGIALATHLIAALIYARGVLGEAGPVCRAVFVLQEIMLFAVAVTAIRANNHAVILFAVYVGAAIYSRRRAFRLVNPEHPRGAAQLMPRRERSA